jgi:exodeoxyribonuclease V alpha subunit
MDEKKSEKIQGFIERLTYHSSSSGYTVARFKVDKNNELITIIGYFADIQQGQRLEITGFYKDHLDYGIQFQVTQYQQIKHRTEKEIERYLSSGIFQGIGIITAKKIVAHFGLETLDILENQISRLAEVSGIAKNRIKHIQNACQSQSCINSVMFFLQRHGVSTTYAIKIYKHYGDNSITKVTENPYQLVTDIYGIGFKTADLIARNLGIATNSEFRYRCGIIQVLREAVNKGHCFLPQTELIKKAIKLLALPLHQILLEELAALITKMALVKELIIESNSGVLSGQAICYLPEFYYTERQLAQQIIDRIHKPITVDLTRVQRWIKNFTQKTEIQLNSQQQQAVLQAASNKVLIITGCPGTGKTFITRTIVALWKAMGKCIALASPTGRAAQRLSEMTGFEAKTLHRLLEFDPKTYSFKRNQDNPISATAIVVDETSMLDLFLAYSFIKAVDDDAQILLVGDINQLPSVGPGRVLQDLIASGQVAVVELTEVFRQAQTSSIVVSSHNINQGKYPKLELVSNKPQSDCLIYTAQNSQEGVEAIFNLVSDLIPNLGFDPVQDVQVLCPMTKTEVGTKNLNLVLQKLINPPSKSKTEIIFGGMTLRVGDRIIQKTNNYEQEVFNGDLGIVCKIDLKLQEVTVKFHERLVTYDYTDLDEITLAWSITIHKSQGSEYPVVILPIFMQHYPILSRNLLYTGLTRAKQLAILVGQEKAISLAIKQVDNNQRYTLLAHRLMCI